MESTKVNKATGWQILGFGFNNASTNAVFLALSTYFLIYCTEIYGLSPITVGLIMTGTRLFDAVTDPIIGILIDKTDTKFGRFRPWILGGAIISGSFYVLMFSGINMGSDFGNILLVTVLYSLFIIGYTAQSTCTKSGQNIVTSVPGQRSVINALGALWTIVVYAIVLATILPMVKAGGGLQVAKGWKNAAFLIAGLQVGFAVLVVLALGKKDVPENYKKLEQIEQPKFRDYISIFKNNKALQMLIVAASTNKISQNIQSALTVVFYYYVVKNQSLQGIVPIVTLLVMTLFMFISIRFISKYGRVEIFRLSSWGGFIYGFVMIFLISLNPESAIWLISVLSINMFLISGTGDQNLISMIGDAADYEYYINGRFIPGMIGTAFSFIDKIISSLSTTITGFILAAVGFVSITETPHSPTMFWTILIMYCGIPALGHLCSVIAMKYHPLTKVKHEEMVTDLAAR